MRVKLGMATGSDPAGTSLDPEAGMWRGGIALLLPLYNRTSRENGFESSALFKSSSGLSRPQLVLDV